MADESGLPLTTVLHVTPASKVTRIAKHGLQRKVGPLSKQLKETPAIFLFPTWADMEDANWLFDNWPYETDCALLAVNIAGLELDGSVGYELVCRDCDIAPERIMVLARDESNWEQAKEQFVAMGGHLHPDNFEVAVQVDSPGM